jgi:hypothetical protein
VAYPEPVSPVKIVPVTPIEKIIIGNPPQLAIPIEAPSKYVFKTFLNDEDRYQDAPPYDFDPYSGLMDFGYLNPAYGASGTSGGGGSSMITTPYAGSSDYGLNSLSSLLNLTFLSPSSTTSAGKPIIIPLSEGFEK